MQALQDNFWKIIFVIFICAIAFIGYKSKTPTQTVATIIEHGTAIDQSHSRETTEAIIKDYIISHPEVIIESIELMQQRKVKEMEEKAKSIIKDKRSELESTANSPFAGNANGDVTLVIFFDYNCGYCKKFNDSVNQLISSDAGVKVIYNPFPILGEGSEYLSRLMLAIYKVSPDKFKAVHDGMMGLSSFNKEDMKAVIEQNGLDMSALEIEMDKPEIRAMQNKIIELATELRINGAPASIISGSFYPGLLDINQLKKIVAEQRGSSQPVSDKPTQQSSEVK